MLTCPQLQKKPEMDAMSTRASRMMRFSDPAVVIDDAPAPLGFSFRFSSCMRALRSLR